MRKIEVETFGSEINAPVIRIPGRQFPGIVVQGDSLKILLDCASEIVRLSGRGGSPELVDSANELKEILSGYLRAYENALKLHSHPLPYTKNLED